MRPQLVARDWIQTQDVARLGHDSEQLSVRRQEYSVPRSDREEGNTPLFRRRVQVGEVGRGRKQEQEARDETQHRGSSWISYYQKL